MKPDPHCTAPAELFEKRYCRLTAETREALRMMNNRLPCSNAGVTGWWCVSPRRCIFVVEPLTHAEEE